MSDKLCYTCGKVSSSVCSKCHSTAYCSKECQVSDWKAGHKSVCSTSKEITIRKSLSFDIMKDISNNKKFDSYIKAFSFYWMEKNMQQGYIEILIFFLDENGNIRYIRKDNEYLYQCIISYKPQRSERHVEINHNNILIEFVCVIKFGNANENDTTMFSEVCLDTSVCMTEYYDSYKKEFKSQVVAIVGKNSFEAI